ncbi:PREDICTED: dynamin-1-like protein [Rhagoletis zephyria]|uniref:dynamin-1-like protein n=1 Tax=Rhagoletis zephyria TaxID=28612 RepID=UPI00081167D7|nr:PREDICTED: dynamin-1-like protein [Rhagoletis zephyria]
MDKGTDAKNVLMGKVIPVKLGIIGCVNRSQQDINDQKSIAKALEDEQKFLQKRYPSLAARHGTAFLAKKLSGILHNHISKCLPDLRRRINTLTSECEENLYKYGEDISEKKDLFIFNILHQYSIDYCSTVEGTSDADLEVEDEKLGCGALICKGTCPGIFIPDKVFKNLAKKEIRSFLQPSLDCVEKVHEKLRKTKDKCEFKEIKKDLIRFPNLSDRINEVLVELLADRVQPTEDFVKSLIKIQLDYINTRNPEFRKEKLELDLSNRGDKNGEKSSRSESPDHSSEDASDSEPEEDDSNLTAVDIENCNIIQHLLKTYIEIVRKTIEDMIPKSIMSFMVVFVKENLQKELVKKLYKEEFFDELLDESEEISFFRQKSLAMLIALEKANGIINEVRNDQSKYCRQNDL